MAAPSYGGSSYEAPRPTYSAPAVTYHQPQTYVAPRPVYQAPTYVQPTYAAPVYEDSYETPSYYSNFYAPIYSINSNPKGKGEKKGNQKNNNIIRSSYDSGYGVSDGDYGKGTPYYASNYYTCVQNDNGNNGKGRGKGNRNGIANLAGLLGGCNQNGGLGQLSH